MEPFNMCKSVKEVSEMSMIAKNTLENLHRCKTQRERLENLRDTCFKGGTEGMTGEEMRYFFSMIVSLEQILALTGIEQVLIEIKCHLHNKR